MLGVAIVRQVEVVLDTGKRLVFSADRVQIEGCTVLLSKQYAGEWALVAVFAPGCWLSVSEVLPSETPPSPDKPDSRPIGLWTDP